jgi:guanosine-3',5'-bis(diphosphate) 3'-pyrophosphohydrolase
MDHIDLQPFIDFVAKCHFPQTYDDQPYIVHPKQVMMVAGAYGIYYPEFRTDEFMIACLGHDLLEDTPCRIKHLRDFGFPVQSIELISLVTDEPGRTRAEKKARTYPKIRRNRLAVGLKLCDRIANVSAAIEKGNANHLGMYADEHPEFKAALQRVGQFEVMWDKLDEHLVIGSKGTCSNG